MKLLIHKDYPHFHLFKEPGDTYTIDDASVLYQFLWVMFTLDLVSTL